MIWTNLYTTLVIHIAYTYDCRKIVKHVSKSYNILRVVHDKSDLHETVRIVTLSSTRAYNKLVPSKSAFTFEQPS